MTANLTDEKSPETAVAPQTPVLRKRKYWTRGRILRRLILLLGIYMGMGAGLAWVSIRPKLHKHLTSPKAYKLSSEDVTFSSKDGTRLSGWYVAGQKGPPKAIVICCHGVDSDRTAMLEKAVFLSRQGYAALLFDFRARGESGGDRCTMGYREVEDLLAALRYIRGRKDSGALPIFVFGESLGGSVALMGAARSPGIAAVIAESPFARMDHALDNHFRKVFGWSGPFVAAPVRWTGELMIGRRCSDIAPADEIKRIAPRPILLIRDGDDVLCPPAETKELMKAAGARAQLWTVMGADHICACMAEPEEFERRVAGFFDGALADINPSAPSTAH